MYLTPQTSWRTFPSPHIAPSYPFPVTTPPLPTTLSFLSPHNGFYLLFMDFILIHYVAYILYYLGFFALCVLLFLRLIRVVACISNLFLYVCVDSFVWLYVYSILNLLTDTWIVSSFWLLWIRLLLLFFLWINISLEYIYRNWNAS